MGSTRPQKLGGFIAVSDSSSLADLDANGLPLGTLALNADVASLFILTASSAALVPDEIIAVKDTAGSRWILFSVSGASVADGVTIDGEGTLASPFSSLGPRAWTRVDVVADVQNVDVVVDGEAACTVEIIAAIIGGQAAADANYTLQPNAVSTGQVSQAVSGTDTTAGAFRPATLSVGYTPDPGGFCYSKFSFVTVAGNRRPLFVSYLYETAASGDQFHASLAGRWNDTSTEITSLRIHSSVADGIGAGSYILWRAILLTP